MSLLNLPASRSAHSRDLIQEFLIIFVAAAGMLLATGVVHYRMDSRADRAALENIEQLNVALGQANLVRNLDGVVSDLMYLAEHNEYQGLFDEDNELRFTTLALEFQVFSKQKGIYDQIRLLDETGSEIARVNYSDGDPRIVPGNQLQNKRDRYYFSATWALQRGQVYISPMDLNVEEGHIEQPARAMLRFGTPFFDSSGHKKGILLFNYLGDILLSEFERTVVNIGDHAMLLNPEGFWLSHPDPHQEWGFMYGARETFGMLYPEAWKRIQSNHTGQFRNAEGLFSFATVYPLLSAVGNHSSETVQFSGGEVGSYYWKVVSRIPSFGAGAGQWFARNLTLYAFMLLLLGTGSVFVARARLRHHQTREQMEFERRFRAILENVDLLAIGINLQGTIEFCNDALLALSGWQRDEILNHNWFDVFIPDESQVQCQQLMQQMYTGEDKPEHRECKIRTRNGDQRLVSWNDSLMYDPEGRIIGLTCIGEDVTEARETEEELRILSRAVEQSPSTVMIVDEKGYIEYVNPKFTELTGYTLEEIKGKNPSILKSGETSSDEYNELWSTIAAGKEWSGVFHNRKKSGELYWEAACISGIRDTNGRIRHYIAVKEDITERKRLEQEVEQRNREIADKQALAATGQMASMIAHDLRNPLSSIKMGLQILGKKTGQAWGEEEHELRQIALQQVGYMEEILEDLLSYSRPEALKPEWLNIDKLLDTSILLVQKPIDEYGVQIKTYYEPGLPTLHGDPGKLKQAFSNMIVNAAQSTESVKGSTPTVTISAKLELADDRPGIRVEICDNGCGIEPAQANQFFEPFFTTRAKGTGLGLAIVKRIVDQHHGKVKLKPVDDGGTCAVAILPTGPVEENQPVTAAASQTAPELLPQPLE